MKNILLLGSGGREHAIAWKIAQSPRLKKLYIAPGNPGMANQGELVNLDIMDFQAVGDFALKMNIDIIVVGPEAPLVEGIKDYFKGKKEYDAITLVGPSKQGAMLEGSKDFAKDFMMRHHIPTAAHKTFNGTNIQAGLDYLSTQKPPFVLKADGLCAGKGVLIIDNLVNGECKLSEDTRRTLDIGAAVVADQTLNRPLVVGDTGGLQHLFRS